MRKILYVLCLLTTLVACSDDDDKIITDYDKPYSKLPTSELRTLIGDNINSCITLVEEFAEMEENNSILDIMNYYGINFYFDISDFMNSRSSDQSKHVYRNEISLEQKQTGFRHHDQCSRIHGSLFSLFQDGSVQ